MTGRFRCVHIEKSYIFFLAFPFLLFSCSVEKRLYQGGYHIEWKKKIKSVSVCYEEGERKETFFPIINSPNEKEKPNALTASVNNKRINPLNPSSKLFITKTPVGREIKFIASKSILFLEDSVLKQNANNNEKQVRKSTKRSFVFGIISAICALPTPAFILSYPVALVFTILAIRRGRKAIDLMGNNPALNTKYRPKARKGIILGMVFYFILLTLLHIALLVGIAAGVLVLILYSVWILSIDYWGAVVAILLGLFAAYWIVKLYIFLMKKILKTIPSKAPLVN